MKLLQKIEAYKTMATEMKVQFPELDCINFRITDVSISEVEKVATQYELTIEESLNRCLRLHVQDYSTYSIFIYSVPCEIKKTLEYRNLQPAA